MKKVKILFLVTLLLLNLFLLHHKKPSYCGFQSEAEYLKVKNAMKFHGILYCEGDGEGNWWFYRDGQKIKLVKGETR